MRPAASDLRPLLILGLLGAIKALALVLVAEGLARGIVAVIAGSDEWMSAAALIAAGGLLRALTGWATAVAATRASIGAKQQLRRELAERVLDDGGGRASTAVLASLGLDELDAYYRTVLPALATTATVPLLIGARILFADWVSAVVILLTVPLVPVFMVLVGQHTKERSDAATSTLERLSNHLAELAKGLPVLVGLGRVKEQSDALRRIGTEHRATTMHTLRSAFLSSLVLELIATISVAIVAVFVGIRLMNGDLTLTVGLIALVLAPECFAPLRELGSAFHASQKGLSARDRVRAIIDAPRARLTRQASTVVGLRQVVVRTVGPLSFSLRRGSTTALDGPSGSGKSTVLGVLAGIVVPTSGEVAGVASIAYVPQHPHTVGSTVLEELSLYGEPGDVLERLGLAGLSGVDPAQLSPGELRRLAVARALVRVEAGAELLLLDEPTAHLDAFSAGLVERELGLLKGRVTMVIASHEAGVAGLADTHVTLGRSVRRAAAAEAQWIDSSILSVEPPLRSEVVETSPAKNRSSLPAFLGASTFRFTMAAILGAAAALFAITLTAVSGWLSVRASTETAIMYLLVAIVGVRFFGLGRAALRYVERLMTHDAVLGATSELRMRLWGNLAERGLASRALARGGVALDYLVAAADDVRDLVPRVVLPPVVALLTSIAAIIGIALLEPAAMPALIAALLIALLVSPAIALASDRAVANRSANQAAVLQRFAAMVPAAGELRANGVGDTVLAQLASLDAAGSAAAKRTSTALGLGGAVTVLTLTLASAVSLAVGQAAATSGPLLGVIVLLPLALIEPLLAHVDAVQQWPSLRSALRKVGELDGPAPTPGTRTVGRVTSLELRDLSAAWGRERVFDDVSAMAGTGDWLVVEGPSGSGKSTLLATVLGYLAPARGAVLLNGVSAHELDPQVLRSRVSWCPQEGHLFDSTVRGNLLLAGANSDKRLTEVLTEVGLDVALEYRVGQDGSRLSGGQRQRLAVARTLLVDSDIVLLDEPTAHLDAEAAENLMGDLRQALRTRIVVLVTHHASERRSTDIQLSLPSSSVKQELSVS